MVRQFIQKFILLLLLVLILRFTPAPGLDPGLGLCPGARLGPGLVLATAPVLVLVGWRWVADGWWL